MKDDQGEHSEFAVPPFEDSLDAANLLWRFSRNGNGPRCSLAMERMQTYARSARVQHARFRESLGRMNGKLAGHEGWRTNWSDDLSQAFVDLHLYFVIWSNVQSMMRVVAEGSGFESAVRAYADGKDLLEDYREARHDMEHYDERLPGGKKVSAMQRQNDLENLSPNEFYFGGGTWNVSDDHLEKLEKIVGDFVEAVRVEGIERWREQRRTEG